MIPSLCFPFVSHSSSGVWRSITFPVSRFAFNFGYFVPTLSLPRALAGWGSGFLPRQLVDLRNGQDQVRSLHATQCSWQTHLARRCRRRSHSYSSAPSLSLVFVLRIPAFVPHILVSCIPIPRIPVSFCVIVGGCVSLPLRFPFIAFPPFSVRRA